MPMPNISSAQKAFIAPYALFVVLLFASDLAGPVTKYWMFPVQTVVCGALLIRFWPCYSFKSPRCAGFSISIAVLVLLIWISPQAFFGASKRLDGFDPTVFQETPLLYFVSLGMRFARLVIVVPLMEEIFWRGFLLRYLVREDFENVPFGSFSGFSFCIVAVGFCLEHKWCDWPAALVTGILYNLVACRTRSLCSCALAHAMTNLLLGFYIIHSRQWGFW
jgi:hypothetical protein